MNRRNFMKHAGAAPLIALSGFNKEPDARALPNDGSDKVVEDPFKKEPSEFAPTHAALHKALLDKLPDVNHQWSIVGSPGTLMGNILIFAAYGAYELAGGIRGRTLEDIVNEELPPMIDRVPERIKKTLQRLEGQYNEPFLSKRTTLWYDTEQITFELNRDILLSKDILCFAFHYGVSHYSEKWRSIAWESSNPLTSHEIIHTYVK
jgi:hypothetical protein